MIRVLVITGILPIPEIEKKKNENDIILVTENNIVDRYSDISFKYIFIFPFANAIMSRISLKWSSYYQLKKQQSYDLKGRSLFLFPVLILPKKTFLQKILIQISIALERRRLKKIIIDFKPTVLHAQDTSVSAFIAKSLSEKYKIPYVITLRGLHITIDNKIEKNINCASSLLAVSHQQLQKAEEITNKTIISIPHGVDESFYSNTTNDKKRIGPLKLILVSRLLAIKNTDMVIHALKNFKHDFKFDIYGDGPEEKTLKSLVVKLGLNDKIQFKGRVPNDQLPTIYPKYDIFIMPSYPEGLGRVYFEAMASGLPVIGSKSTGIDGIITNGKEGYILNPLQKEEFDIELLKILNELYINPLKFMELSKNATCFSKDYTWDEIAAKYYKVYNQYRTK